jgi:hypothetical protein
MGETPMSPLALFSSYLGVLGFLAFAFLSVTLAANF